MSDTPDEIRWRRAQEALPLSERTFDFEAWASEKAQARRKIDAGMNELDVAEFLCHADMIPALQSGNAEAVGHIALRLYNAWLDECAEMKADAS